MGLLSLDRAALLLAQASSAGVGEVLEEARWVLFGVAGMDILGSVAAGEAPYYLWEVWFLGNWRI